MAEERSIYSQFAKVFSSAEEMEAYKKELYEERTQKHAFQLNLQLFGSGSTETEQGTQQNSSVAPTIKPSSQIERKKDFSTVRQGTSTNALTKLRATEGKGLNIDNITGVATIKSGNFTLALSNFGQIAGLKTSTHQLFDAITAEFTESGAKSPTVILPLEEYMEKRGLKDRKEAKAQAKADMETLRGASISWEEKRSGKTESYGFMNIADSGEIRRNGDIVFTYGSTFYNVMLGYPVALFPKQLWTLNSKKNPNSYYFLRKISEHKNMNIGKENENIISVKTLLASTPYLPSYEEVMKGNRNIQDRIITPFERDMDAFEETLSWNYCHSKNEPLTDEELSNMSYEVFENSLIFTSWKNYPDQTKRLEKKAERIEKAKAKEKKANKKKKQDKE